MNGHDQYRADDAATITIKPRPLVLLVEDSAMVRRVYGRVLVSAGFRVLVPGSLPEALRLAQEIPDINLVLTNHEMPGAAPPEVVRWFEGRPGRRPILLITAWPEGMNPPAAPAGWTIRWTSTTNADDMPAIATAALHHT